MALPTQMIGGLVSGMDTNAIIEQLMSIEKISMTRLENKKSELDLQLEAYQSVNNLLLEFSTKASELADESIWKTTSSSSSNESALGINSTESAVPGTHQFKVSRLASNAKFMSAGFSTMDDPVLPAGIDTKKVETEYDLDTQIADFNNGDGVELGWITLTQGANEINIDLSSCKTMKDVVFELSGQASTAGIHLSVNIYNESNQELAEQYGMPMGLSITCDNPEDGALVFSNYTGTDHPASTAADSLGLTSLTALPNTGLSGAFEGDDLYGWNLANPTEDEAVNGSITLENALGRCVRDTEVKELNGGNGIYHGSIRVSNSDGDVTEIDLSSCESLNDITNTINSTYGVGIETYVEDNEIRVRDKVNGSESLYIQNVGAGTTADDLGLSNLTYDAANDVYVGENINQINERTSLKMLRDGLGINNGTCGDILIKKDGKEYVVSLGKAQTIGDIMYAIEHAEDDSGNKISGISASIDGNGLHLESTDGSAFSVRSDPGSGDSNTTALDLGIDTDTNDVTSFTGYKLIGDLNSVQISRLMGTKSFDRDTTLLEYNNIQAGETITVTDKLGKSVTFTAEADSTIGDLLDAVNNPDDACQAQLFLEPETNSFTLADTTNVLAWVFDSTNIADLKNGEFFDESWAIGVKDSTGTETTFNFAGCTTIGDVIEKFNTECTDAGIGLEAKINSSGTGIDIEDTAGGDGDTVIGEIGSDAHAAELFGIAGEGTGGINGILEKPDDFVSPTPGDLTVTGLIAEKIGFAAGNNTAAGDTTGIQGTQFIFNGINGSAGMKGILADGSKYNTIDGVNLTVDGTDYTLDLSSLNSDDSMNDLLKTLNAQAETAGVDVQFVLNNAKNGISVVNNTGSDITFSNIANTSRTATDLGFTGKTFEAGKTKNAGDLDTQWIARSTTLESLTGDKSFYAGTISITNTAGGMSEISLSGAETIGDVIDIINNNGVGITAGINASGDGLVIFDDANGEGKLTIGEVGGGSTAEKLGILGSGDYMVDGSFERTITVDQDDDLRDVMNKVAYCGIDVQCSIINDGSDFAPYRLSITSTNSGKESDLLLDTDISAFNFTKTSDAKDAVLLYGQGNSGVSPVMMTSATNENNSAVLGLELDLKQTSEDWITVSVSQEKDTVKTGIEDLVSAYNTIVDLIDEFDDWDSETEQPGIFFADSNTRSLMNALSDTFFTIAEGEKGEMCMWYDIGVKFNDEGHLEIDSSVLSDKINNNFAAVKNLMCKSIDVARSDLAATVSTTDKGATDPKNAINGNNDQDVFNDGNGFESLNAIDEENGYQYTVNFDQIRTLDYLSIYHVNTEDMPAAEYALESYLVEYLDKNNTWQEMRKLENNTQAINTLGFAEPTQAKAIRITGYETHAEDGKFRLAEIEAMESQGLSAKQSVQTDSLSDSINGWFASIKETIDNQQEELDTQIEKLEERLEDKELSLINTYANMESNLQNIKAQGDYFASQASSWSS